MQATRHDHMHAGHSNPDPFAAGTYTHTHTAGHAHIRPRPLHVLLRAIPQGKQVNVQSTTNAPTLREQQQQDDLTFMARSEERGQPGLEPWSRAEVGGRGVSRAQRDFARVLLPVSESLPRPRPSVACARAGVRRRSAQHSQPVVEWHAGGRGRGRGGANANRHGKKGPWCARVTMAKKQRVVRAWRTEGGERVASHRDVGGS